MKGKNLKTAIILIVGLIGLSLIIWKSSLLMALGIFLLMWANNMDLLNKKN
jgi:hypothetical protein